MIETVNLFLRETLVSNSIRHENFVPFYGVILTPPDFYLVYEYCDEGNLNDYILQKDIPWKVRIDLLKQITNGMSYMHLRNMLHRDLKTTNIFLCTNKKTGELQIKIGDFGLSRVNNV
eukprot:UN28202